MVLISKDDSAFSAPVFLKLSAAFLPILFCGLTAELSKCSEQQSLHSVSHAVLEFPYSSLKPQEPGLLCVFLLAFWSFKLLSKLSTRLCLLHSWACINQVQRPKKHMVRFSSTSPPYWNQFSVFPCSLSRYLTRSN